MEYILEYGGGPDSEVFCCDFIHNVILETRGKTNVSLLTESGLNTKEQGTRQIIIHRILSS
jgi:hypothetical protein